MALDPKSLKRQFPLFRDANKRGEKMAYLDSCATTQKPDIVIEAMVKFYETSNANVHRGIHGLTERATTAYETSRDTVRDFIHARSRDEIIFTRGTTESVNLVARSLGSAWKKGNVIVISILEHHSNVIPWMQVATEQGLMIKWVECDEAGHLRIDQLEKYLEEGNVRMVAVTGQSNVLGVRPDLSAIIEAAHTKNALVLVDAAQLVAHAPIDVTNLDCDFLAFSGHKLYAPTGIGVLYGKRELLESMPPFLGGGSMVKEVTRDGFSPADLPMKFEAGTPAIAEVIGLSAAIEWLKEFSWEDRILHERSILTSALTALSSIEGLSILGPKNAEEISGCISFTMEGIHAHDVTEILSSHGIYLRAGHHCAAPLHDFLGVPATSRLSIALYTTPEDIEALREGLTTVRATFQ